MAHHVRVSNSHLRPSLFAIVWRSAVRDRSFSAAAQSEMAKGGFDIYPVARTHPGCMIFRAGDGVHAAWLVHRARVLNAPQKLVC